MDPGVAAILGSVLAAVVAGAFGLVALQMQRHRPTERDDRARRAEYRAAEKDCRVKWERYVRSREDYLAAEGRRHALLDDEHDELEPPPAGYHPPGDWTGEIHLGHVGRL